MLTNVVDLDERLGETGRQDYAKLGQQLRIEGHCIADSGDGRTGNHLFLKTGRRAKGIHGAIGMALSECVEDCVWSARRGFCGLAGRGKQNMLARDAKNIRVLGEVPEQMAAQDNCLVSVGAAGTDDVPREQ